MERSTVITTQLAHWNAAMNEHAFCPITDACMKTFITFNIPVSLSILYHTALPFGSHEHITELFKSHAIHTAWQNEYGFAPTPADVDTFYELIHLQIK